MSARMTGGEALAEIQARLAAADAADAARRVVCPVCRFRTADIGRHEREHSKEES